MRPCCGASATPDQPVRDCAVLLHGSLDSATVLCVGRGRFYPALAVAVGERVGLIGAMSVETAARFLNSRDIEGIVIGDGFGPAGVVEALLTVLAEDVRFLATFRSGCWVARTCAMTGCSNLIQVERDPDCLVGAPAAVLRGCRRSKATSSACLNRSRPTVRLDPATGLFAHAAFWNDLERAGKEVPRAPAAACRSPVSRGSRR